MNRKSEPFQPLNEAEKMLQGLWYDANYDEELLKDRLIAEDLCFDLNNTRPSDTKPDLISSKS